MDPNYSNNTVYKYNKTNIMTLYTTPYTNIIILHIVLVSILITKKFLYLNIRYIEKFPQLFSYNNNPVHNSDYF
jgi:hypothetical protein